MEENDKGMGLGELLHRAFIAIKRRIVLVLAVILVFVAGGTMLAYVRKPLYTASESVTYKAGNDDASNYTSLYFKSVIEFCSSGCVVDRANFYYDRFIKSSNISLSEFIKKASDAQSNSSDPLYYDSAKRIDVSYITNKNLSVKESSVDGVSYMLTISYTDASTSNAYNKLQILIGAIKDEVNISDSNGRKMYFPVKITIEDFGYKGASANWSKSRVITIAAVIGIIVALLAVYIINLTDRTIKDKKEIERITGVSLIAFIEDQEA